MLVAACGGDGGETPVAEQATAAPAATLPPVATVPPTAEEAQEKVAIRFAIFDWDQGTYGDLIDAFEEENPGIEVQVVSINEVLDMGELLNFEWPDDAERRLAAAADVLAMEASAQTVEEGLIRDLTPFIEADARFQPDDFFPHTLETYQWEGGTWSLPTTLNFQLIFFDKEAFDAAGEPYPEAGWSWDDLLAKASALTLREGDLVTRWGLVAPTSDQWTLIESRVGPLVDESTEPPTPRFDEAEVIDAVRWLTNLHLREEVMPYFAPGDEGDILPEAQTLIDEGQAAMWPQIDVVWWWRNQQGNVGVVPFPVDDPGDQSTPSFTSGLSMSAGTTQPAAAWQFLDFLNRQAVGSLGLGTQSLPARRSVAESSGYWDAVDQELAAALRYALEHSHGQPGSRVGYGAFNDALQAIIEGEESVEDALADVQAQAEADIAQEGAAGAGATPAPTIVVAPAETEAPVGEGVVTITFVPGLGSLNLGPYRDLAERFHELYPDVVVEVEMADLMSGTVPDLPSMAEASDCFEWYPGFQEARNREAILDLGPFLDADSSLSIDDFYPQTVEQFTWQGRQLGLPAGVTPYIMEYNKDLFDAAGEDYPALDWTWDEFVALAVALTQGEDEEKKQYGYVSEVYELNDLLFFLERLGAKLIDEGADPPALSFDDPATIEAMRTYASLSTEYGVKPVFLTDISKLAGATAMYLEREGLINEGRAAMWTNAGTTAAIFGERTELNLGAVPLPSQPGYEAGGYSGATGYFISAGAENRQACWQWITFLSGEPGAVQGLPARRSVAESEAYRQQVGAERADAYLASVANVDRPSSFQTFSDEEWLGTSIFWLGQAYGRVVEGELSVEDALAAAQQLADDYRACVVAADDFSEETANACAQEVDPTLPAFLFQTGQ
jgi:multiple sugar transport system substrate-binding protein